MRNSLPNIDADLRNADWLRTRSWDLPINPDKFLAYLVWSGQTVQAFLQKPAAQAMPEDLRTAITGGFTASLVARLTAAGEWNPDLHPRGEHGYFGQGGGLPQTSFVDPKTGRQLTRTDIGDTFEQLLADKGAHILEQRYGGDFEKLTSPTSRQSPLDIRVGDRGFEVKSLNIEAKNQRIAMKPEEVASKLAYAEEHNLKPGVLLQSVDHATGTVKLLVYEDGVASKQASTMTHIGTYHYTEEEFRATLKNVRANR